MAEFNCTVCGLIVPDAAVSRRIHMRICATVASQREATEREAKRRRFAYAKILSKPVGFDQ